MSNRLETAAMTALRTRQSSWSSSTRIRSGRLACWSRSEMRRMVLGAGVALAGQRRDRRPGPAVGRALGVEQVELQLEGDHGPEPQGMDLIQDPIDPDFASGPIFHDCQLEASGPAAIHIALTDIEYPAEVMGRLVLVHYGDNLEDHLETIDELGFRIARPGQIIDSADW